MSKKPTMGMIDEQINAAIAEACGWKLVTDDPNYETHWLSPNGHMIAVRPNIFPDYCNDLNAMHEAFKTLTPDQIWDVAYSLPMETMLGFMATARELAETFLMVIGKWEATDKDSLTVGKEEK
jgi:hypothetical protein